MTPPVVLPSLEVSRALREKRHRSELLWDALLGAFVIAMVILSALFVTGCRNFLDGAVRTVNAAQVVLHAAEEGLAVAHVAERDKAVEAAKTEAEARAAVAVVHARYEKAWETYERAREVWQMAHGMTAVARRAPESAEREEQVRLALAELVAAVLAVEARARELGVAVPSLVGVEAGL